MTSPEPVRKPPNATKPFEKSAWNQAGTSLSATDLYRSVQICTDLYRSVQICTDLYRSVQICTDLYRSVLICTDLYRSVQICTDLWHSGWFQPGSMLIFQMVSWRLEVSGLVPDWSRFSRLYFSNWHPISGSGLGFRTGARLEIQFSVLILYFRTGSGLVRVQVCTISGLHPPHQLHTELSPH